MKRFYVRQDTNHIKGHLVCGYREGYIEAESKEDALDKLKNEGWAECLDFIIDDFEIEEANYDDMPFEITEAADWMGYE